MKMYNIRKGFPLDITVDKTDVKCCESTRKPKLKASEVKYRHELIPKSVVTSTLYKPPARSTVGSSKMLQTKFCP